MRGKPSICGRAAGINDLFPMVGRSLFQAAAKLLLVVHLRQKRHFVGSEERPVVSDFSNTQLPNFAYEPPT